MGESRPREGTAACGLRLSVMGALSPVRTVTCVQRPEIEAGTVRVGSKGTVPAILQEQQDQDSCSTVGNRESGRRGGPGLWLRGRPWWEQVYYTWEHNRFTSSSSLDDGRGHPFSLETYKIGSAFSFSKLWKLFLFLNDPIPPGVRLSPTLWPSSWPYEPLRCHVLRPYNFLCIPEVI